MEGPAAKAWWWVPGGDGDAGGAAWDVTAASRLGKRLAEVATKEGGRAWSLGRKIGSGARIYGALVAAGNNDKKGK
jgi:hypothetical protein